MRWANAGHPPPLVLHPDESLVSLDRGTTVLLYTDGLIERRNRDLDDGMRAGCVPAPAS
ncbi:putative PAS domain S-box (fragment) [Blastococcus saxobsidens DD2]|uniref:Putative PAS domain S-box n=1 Tax=Blastococcus saxobsidens (strain DD2) TaxID=1146883 RepID=H6RP49_BLASD